MKCHTCLELGVCQSRPDCTVCHSAPVPRAKAPITMEGPFVSERTAWLQRTAHRAVTAAAVCLVLGTAAGIAAGRIL